MPRYLGIDFGASRVGLALSDSDGIIAQPYGAIEWSDTDDLIEQIAEIITEKRVEIIVIGHPIHLSGESSEMSRKVEDFAKLIGRRLPDKKLVLVDERLSTKQAEAAIREGGGKPSLNKEAVDTVAAAIILQSYLERCYEES